jgi:putative ABC transport system permease protein
MLNHYIKIAWRNFLLHKQYGAINILGLAAGLASFIGVLLYLNYELSYDSWHPSLKRVHKVSMIEGSEVLPATPAPLAAYLQQNLPYIEAATAINYAGSYQVQLEANNTVFFQEGLVTADSLFFKVFPYELAVGSTATALNSPNAVIISEEVAQKLFGLSNPLGQTLKLYNSYEGQITGVLKKPTTPSHLNVQILMRDPYQASNTHWQNYSYDTYIKLSETSSIDVLDKKLSRAYYNAWFSEKDISYTDYVAQDKYAKLYAEPVGKLQNQPRYGPSNTRLLLVLVGLAGMLLLAGCINFSNLSIVKAMGRAKEVGMRKVMGSSSGQIVVQLMCETALQSLLALLLAVLLVQVSLPYFNQSFGLELQFWQSAKLPMLLLQVTVALVIVILLSGLYPALLSSRFTTAHILKGGTSQGRSGKYLRNLLLVTQFIITAFFIICIVAVNRQLIFLQQYDKGLNEEQVLRLEASQQVREQGFEKLKHELESIAGVASVAKTTAVPGSQYYDSTTYRYVIGEQEHRLVSVKVSADYFNTLGVNLLEGRNFKNNSSDDSARTAIVNQAAAKLLGPDSPVGKIIRSKGCSQPTEVIGLVNDFQVAGPERRVLPTLFTIGNNECMYQSGGAVLVKLNGQHLPATLAALEKVWTTIEPGVPLRYSFLDTHFQNLLSSYFRLQKVITFFGITALLISLTGLFALTAYATDRRTKEIVIRKVLGASMLSLILGISRELVLLIGLAMLIALPLAYAAVNYWLESFAYRIALPWYFYLAIAVGLASVALGIITWQIYRAVNSNPVTNLRSE